MLRVLTAVALVGVAVVHLRIAHTYTSVGRHPLAIGDQFVVQGVLALVLAAAVLLRPAAVVWAACGLFAVGSLAVLVYSRYHALPVYGFAGGFQESWQAPGATTAAGFEAAGVVLSAAGLALSRRRTPAARLSAG